MNPNARSPKAPGAAEPDALILGMMDAMLANARMAGAPVEALNYVFQQSVQGEKVLLIDLEQVAKLDLRGMQLLMNFMQMSSRLGCTVHIVDELPQPAAAA